MGIPCEESVKERGQSGKQLPRRVSIPQRGGQDLEGKRNPLGRVRSRKDPPRSMIYEDSPHGAQEIRVRLVIAKVIASVAPIMRWVLG